MEEIVPTCGFEEFLSRAEDDITVPVCAEEEAYESPSICHSDPHVLVKEPLQFLPGLGGGRRGRGGRGGRGGGHFRLVLYRDTNQRHQ